MSDDASNQPACPERIEHPRFVLRCRDEADAPRFREVIDRNLDHLRRFMPWAHNEPRPVGELAERIRAARETFVRGEEWQFGIFSPDEARVLGAIGLHRGAAPATLEIGFWLCRSAEGQGIATEATRILTNLALTSLGAERVEIRCDVHNERSAAVPRRLGFVLVETRDEIHEGTPRRAQTWVRTQPLLNPAGPDRKRCD
jgi:RimJ/RimL family protein N-acetyltransferase